MQEYRNKAREAKTRVMAIVMAGRRRAGKQDRLPERGECNGHEKQSKAEGELRREERGGGEEGGRRERKGSDGKNTNRGTSKPGWRMEKEMTVWCMCSSAFGGQKPRTVPDSTSVQ